MTTVNITMIVDRSGSMSTMLNEVIGGINAFYAEQKKLPDPATVTYIQFDNFYEKVFENVPLPEVKDISYETFQPRGMTALYDAIGKTLVEMNPAVDSKQVIMILTDGEENSSKEFNHSAVKSIVESSQKKGWEIIFMGANIDAEKVGGGLGIKAGNSATFTANAIGAKSAYTSMSSKMSSMRSAVASGVSDWAGAGGSMASLYSSSVDSLTKGVQNPKSVV